MKKDDEYKVRKIAQEVYDEKMHEAKEHRAPKPVHWDGEPCNAPVCEVDIERTKDLRFEFTKEFHIPNGEWVYATTSGWGEFREQIVWCRKDLIGAPEWILRAVRKEELAPKLEDWIVKIGGVEVTAEETKNGNVRIARLDGHVYNADWDEADTAITRAICKEFRVPIKPFGTK